MRGNIVNLVQAHFLLLEGKEMRNAILKRIGKAWKNHRYALKKDYLILWKKRVSKIMLVYLMESQFKIGVFWLIIGFHQTPRKCLNSEKLLVRRKFSCARVVLKALQIAELFCEGDGRFKEGTTSHHQFVEDAIKKVQESLDYSSSSIPKVDIENEVFNQLMYQGEIPKRPLNYGFGVMQSDIFGVEGHLRKEGSYYVNNSDMEVEKLKVALLDMKKQNEDVDEQNQILKTKFDAVGSMMAQVLKATRSGNVSSEVIDNAIQLLDSQVVDDVGSNGKE